MKANIGVNVICPKCADIMHKEAEALRCSNQHCKLYEKRYEWPTVELVEVSNKGISYEELLEVGKKLFNFAEDEPFVSPEEIIEIARQNCDMGLVASACVIYAGVLAQYIEENK